MAASPPRPASPRRTAARRATAPSTRSAPSADEAWLAAVDAMRRFNRFYTRQLGLLDESLLGSGLTLAEARVMFELAQGGEPSAAELGARLQLDAGHLSRVLTRLQGRRLLRRAADAHDGRVQRLVLSRPGQACCAALDQGAREQLLAQTAHLSDADRRELVAALATVQRLLDPQGAAPRAAFVLRDPRPGDMGWVVHRQAVLYTHEYGWDAGFEALVAEIVARFVQRFDARRERCWIAEREGRIVGSIFLVRESDDEARLRLLYVEAEARGSGLGAALVDACIADARAKGYRRLTLWTNDVLAAARRIYQSRGFVLQSEERHHSFGKDLVGQHWSLVL